MKAKWLKNKNWFDRYEPKREYYHARALFFLSQRIPVNPELIGPALVENFHELHMKRLDELAIPLSYPDDDNEQVQFVSFASMITAFHS